MVYYCAHTIDVAQAKCIITANERVVSESNIRPLKENVDAVMKDTEVNGLVKRVFWARRTDKAVEENPHDVDLDKVHKTMLNYTESIQYQALLTISIDHNSHAMSSLV